MWEEKSLYVRAKQKAVETGMTIMKGRKTDEKGTETGTWKRHSGVVGEQVEEEEGLVFNVNISGHDDTMGYSLWTVVQVVQKSNRKELEGSALDYVQCPPPSD
ncbi:hypothetical protein RUM43_013396 [Polyplax serrata]|uniref:Uncharacterized protein n=1 Tax=Polyplax serrata TaxID=468196 RepID=A0AAN8PJ29_POLSC